MRSITSTSVVHKSQYISGIMTRPRPSILRRNWAALEASRIRSSSSCRYLSNSATTSRGLRRRPSSDQPSINPAIQRIRPRSWSIASNMPGRKTLIATSRSWPWRSRIRPKCTCAIEALATGRRSNCTNNSEIGLPNDFSMAATARSESKGGTWSCSLASSSAISTGNRSRRVEMTWPSFTKIGPRCSKAMRRRAPRACCAMEPAGKSHFNSPSARPGGRLSNSRVCSP